MQTITQITHEVNQKSKLNSKETTQKVIQAFLETIQQKLAKGESLNFKGYFTIKRITTKPKGSKYCSKHEKVLNDYKQTNKGKGIAAFAKSAKFRGLVQEAKKCKECQKKKESLLKLAKMTNRVSFKASEGLWKVGRKR